MSRSLLFVVGRNFRNSDRTSSVSNQSIRLVRARPHRKQQFRTCAKYCSYNLPRYPSVEDAVPFVSPRLLYYNRIISDREAFSCTQLREAFAVRLPKLSLHYEVRIKLTSNAASESTLGTNGYPFLPKRRNRYPHIRKDLASPLIVESAGTTG